MTRAAKEASVLCWLRTNRWARIARAVFVAGSTAASLSSCDLVSRGPEPAALAFAAALETGDFGAVPLAGASAADASRLRDVAFGMLEPSGPAVELGDVSTDEATAEAALAFAWDVGIHDAVWAYETRASLVRVEGEWQVLWSTDVLAPGLVDGESLYVRRVPAKRADVLGAGDSVIVEGRPVYHIGIDKTRLEVDQQAAAARDLALALGMDDSVYARQVEAAGDQAFVETIVVRQGDPDYDLAALSSMQGVTAVPDEIPLAPTRRFAWPILGTVGEATAEIVESSEGSVLAGDLVGLSGLQRQYDAQLRGQPGVSVIGAAGDGGSRRELFTVAPVPGTPLVTTLDPQLQLAAEEILSAVDPPSAIVALRPSTGEIQVAASGPGGGGYSTATLGSYAPGSTFKVVSSLALLRTGLTPDSNMPCPSEVVVDGYVFVNYPGYPEDALGNIPLWSAFAHSCNTAFVSSRERLSQAALVEAAASLGFGYEGPLGFPAFVGAVPTEATGTDHAASLIGQGRILASPLAVAVIAASVARGALVTPRLVVMPPSTDNDESAVASSAPPTAVRPITSAEAEALRSMMRATVTEGSYDFLLNVPGEAVLAKSGTAQFGAGDSTLNHTWMIAVWGDLAVAVFVEEGEYGTTTSGPLLEAFLREAAF